MPYPFVDSTPQVTTHPQAHNAYVDVMAHFGAKGDGATDDSGAIQAAITATGWPTTAGTVFFPVGTYKITSGFTLSAGGASSTPELHFVSDGATIVTTSAITMFTITDSIVSVTRVKFRGIYFHINAGTAATGVLLNNAELCEFLSCGFGGSFSTGVKITGTSTNNRFSSCEFANMARGIHINGAADYLQIVNCSFTEQLSGSPLNWIEADNGSLPSVGITVVGCGFYGTGGTLPTIRSLYGNGWTIAGNTFNFSDQESIWLGADGSSYGHTVSGNTFQSGQRHDVYLNGARQNVINGNVFGPRGAGVASNTYSAVRIANTFGGAAGSDNIVTSNRSLDSASALNYVVEADAGCDYCVITSNSGAAGFSAPGANNQLANNITH